MPSATDDGDGPDLVERTAASLRALITDGELGPGRRLDEPSLTDRLSVSRNTLRESFRVLVHEGLVERVPNRGVFVRRPGLAEILDIYRVRRMIEEQAVRQATPRHPAISRAVAAVDAAERHRDGQEWRRVGTDNMVFHAALVALADSPRLDDLFLRLQAELRLAFVTLADPEYLHAPFVDLNRAIADLVAADRMSEAADALDAYFTRSERMVLAAIGRR